MPQIQKDLKKCEHDKKRNRGYKHYKINMHKIYIKRTLNGINNILDTSEEEISEHEGREIEMKHRN